MNNFSIKKILLIVFFMWGSTMSQNTNSKNQSNLNLSITEQMAFSTVRIEVKTGRSISVGTGFFFNFLEDDNGSVPAIVTNNHVVKNAEEGTFILTNSNIDGTPNMQNHIPITLKHFEKYWIFHPDKSIDLAIMPIAPLLLEAKKKGFRPFYINLNKSLIPNKKQIKELSPAEEILMVG